MADQQPKGVLINYQGDDNGQGFAHSLWKTLSDKGLHTKLCFRWGIPLNKLDDYMVAIVIFPENFTEESTDDELAVIYNRFKRENDNPQFLYPIFYNTNPSHVKMTADKCDFTKCYTDQEIDLLYIWHAAVSKIIDLPGWYFKHRDGNESLWFSWFSRDGNESEFIDKIVEDASRMLHGDPPLHMRREVVKVPLSRTVHKVARFMLSISLVVFQAEKTWRVVGFMSCVVGLLCYALDPSFNRLFGRWNPFKVSLYVVLSLAILTAILKANKASPPTWYVQLKNICITFAVLMIISVYSFFYDRAVNGKPNILSLISNAAFALVSVSLHRLLKFGVEMGVFSYFVGCFTIQLLTINKMLIFVAIIYGFLLFVLHSLLNFPPNVASGRQDHQV